MSATLPRAIGVSRDIESPGGKGVSVAFERALSDEELRGLHQLLGTTQTIAERAAQLIADAKAEKRQAKSAAGKEE